jgi:hypothetical protein
VAHRNHFQGLEKPPEVSAVAPRLQAATGPSAQSQTAAITAHTHLVLGPPERWLRQNYDRRLSLLKFMRFLSQDPARLLRVLQALKLGEPENRAGAILLLRPAKTPELFRNVGGLGLT